MENLLVKPVSASELAAMLDLPWHGNDCHVDRVASLDRLADGCLAFSKSGNHPPLALRAVIIAPPDTPAGAGAVIASVSPRLSYAKALQRLVVNPGFASTTEAAQVHPEARVSPQAWIDKGVRIGRGSVVGPFAVISSGVVIGEDCVIKPGAVIGEPGFGFERDDDGTPVRLVHFGRVIIGNRVEIGSHATLCRGTLDDTVIEDDVKIDDQVHVSHNCRIRRGAMIVACAELCGSVEIGAYAWIGPNSSVLQKIHVGERAFVGLGVNVMREVGQGDTVAGYPGRSLGPRPGAS